MEEIVVESWNLPKHKQTSPCWKKWEELSPRWKKWERPVEEAKTKSEEGEEMWKRWKSSSPPWKSRSLKDCIEEGRERSCCYPQVNLRESEERSPQSCISKPYLNLAEALLLDECVLREAKILTSPCAVYIDVCKLVEHFPNLVAGYNIFIKVKECNAELIRKLNLNYGLFLLDPLAPELTLTVLLPHLNPEGCYVFFYDKGMICINKDMMVVKDTQLPENLCKLVRSPREYPCKEGYWHDKGWRVMAVNLNKINCNSLEKLSQEGTVILEHTKIHNKGNMLYGNYILRQFIETLVLSMNCTQLPNFILSGIGSVPLLESIIYVYAQQNNLILDGCKIKTDYLIESWAGDCLRGVVTMQQIKKFIQDNRGKANYCHELMLEDPLLIMLAKEEQDLYAFGKPFAEEGTYKPHLLKE